MGTCRRSGFCVGGLEERAFTPREPGSRGVNARGVATKVVPPRKSGEVAITTPPRSAAEPPIPGGIGRGVVMNGSRPVLDIRQSFTILVLAATALARPALAATLAVASTGVDSATCGGAANPCRSISRAIANAAAGDTIVVGPGRYGDLNLDGNFSDPGDEAAQIGTGCSCMINVDKPLTIVSRDGASPTVLDVTSGSSATDVVHIGVGDVVFGE